MTEEYEYQRRYLHLGGNDRDPDEVWKNAKEHRGMITRIVTETSQTSGGQLAILGAGLCNDINLNKVKDSFSNIHLIDIDGEAIWKGLEYQSLTNSSSITIHGQTDVTGVAKKLEECKTSGFDDSKINAIVQSLKSFRLPEMAGKFDVVLSTCLLSQLNEHVISCVGDEHPRLVELLLAVRVGHLSLLADLCSEQGIAILVFDFVSTESLPGMEGFKGEDLRQMLTKAIEQHNFFHGMNPVMISETMQQHPELSKQLKNVRSALPWVWNATGRHYAVTAVSFQSNK